MGCVDTFLSSSAGERKERGKVGQGFLCRNTWKIYLSVRKNGASGLRSQASERRWDPSQICLILCGSVHSILVDVIFQKSSYNPMTQEFHSQSHNREKCVCRHIKKYQKVSIFVKSLNWKESKLPSTLEIDKEIDKTDKENVIHSYIEKGINYCYSQQHRS